LKVELYSLIKAHKPLWKSTIDKVLTNAALRLPPYQCDLNPIELIWNLLKEKVKTRITSSVSLSSLKEISEQALNEIPKEDWKKVCDHVKKIADDYWRRDALLEDEIERIVI
ncbi:hypothetical protein C0J52_14325, partial [Blattella germanica]